MKNNFNSLKKNFLKLSILIQLMSGCVVRQPYADRKEEHIPQKDGTIQTNICTAVGNRPEFTLLGNVWNTGTFGTLGCLQGALSKSYEGFSNTNDENIAQRVWDGSSGFVVGAGQGLYRGMVYGATLKYDEGRSVEGKIFDTIEFCSDTLLQHMKELDR